ncbi:CBU_0592 family membrane protein [Sulfurimonas sp.]|uniref:CBU_0592 family membrane protein n=1 Tax=Sulfurimonas sp. TaxID=2022749 RepID=UPI003D0AC2C1
MSAFMVDAIGIIGVVMVLITYFLLQSQKIDSKGFLYSFLNAFGSLLIVYSLLYNWNLASFIIEFFWILISLWGLKKWYRSKKESL